MYMASISINTNNLIPIYYRIPFGVQNEIVSGYLEKKHVENGKRFYGHFRCENCGHEWRSGHTWQGYRQECRKCELKNWPEKVYHLEQSAGLISEEPHREDLCEKCQSLGHNCQETHGFGGFGLGRNNKFDQCFNKQFELERYDILLEPQFIQDLFDCLWDDLDTSDRSEFKDALKFALEKWRIKGEDDQITACEDLVRKIDDAIQRESRTRKRSASSNRSSSPADPGTSNTSNVPLNDDLDELAWHPYDEDTSPSIISSGRTSPNQPIGSSPRPSAWNDVATPDTSARVKPIISLVPQPISSSIDHNMLSQTNNSTTPRTSNLILVPRNNPVTQPDNNSSSRPKNNPAPQPNNKSSRRKNKPAPQPNNNPPSDPNDNLTVDPDEDPVRNLSMLTVLILAIAMLVYFAVSTL